MYVLATTVHACMRAYYYICVIMCHYVSLCVIVCHCVSLCVIMCDCRCVCYIVFRFSLRHCLGERCRTVESYRLSLLVLNHDRVC